jgi:small conductance mechanosensitive channel
MLRRALLLAVVIVALLTILSGVWRLPITPFVAVASALGVALGFGAQKLVQDVIAGFFMLLEDQFRIGNLVSMAGVTGEVQDIRLRVTVLRDANGTIHYVPNGEVKVSTNLSEGYARVFVDVPIATHSDVEAAITAVSSELAQLSEDQRWHRRLLEEPSVLGVESWTDSSLVVRSVARVNPSDRNEFQREALRRIKSRFDREGIDVPPRP